MWMPQPFPTTWPALGVTGRTKLELCWQVDLAWVFARFLPH